MWQCPPGALAGRAAGITASKNIVTLDKAVPGICNVSKPSSAHCGWVQQSWLAQYQLLQSWVGAQGTGGTGLVRDSAP